MKKIVYESLLEFERAMGDPNVIKDRLNIGSLEERAKGVLKKFADDNGYEFEDRDSARGRSLRMRVPISYTEKDHYGNTSIVNGLEYTITFPEGWDETPMSLRKRWQGNKGYSGQNLIGRFAKTDELMRRLKVNIKNEMKHVQKDDEKPEDLLIRAVLDSDLAKVKELLKDGVSPDHKLRGKIEKNIPILLAAQRGNFKVFKALVDAGAELNVKTKNGKSLMTVLLGAWRNESVKAKMLEYVLDKGIDPYLGNNLTWGLQHAPIEIFQIYMDAIDLEKLDPSQVEDLATTCAWMGYWKKMKILLSKGLDPNIKGRQGSLLQTAIKGEESGSTWREREPYESWDKTRELIKKAGGR